MKEDILSHLELIALSCKDVEGRESVPLEEQKRYVAHVVVGNVPNLQERNDYFKVYNKMMIEVNTNHYKGFSTYMECRDLI